MQQELYREKSIHGSFLFPFECYIQDSKVSLLVKDHHWHEEMEWIYLIKGQIKIEIDFKEYTIGENTLVCIPIGALHKIRTCGECLYYAYVFKIQMLQALIYDNCESDFIIPILNGEIAFQKVIKLEDSTQKVIFQELITLSRVYIDKEMAWQMEVKASLLKTMAYLIKYDKLENEELKTKGNLLERSEKIKKIITYLRTHMQDKVYISELAALISMNETYFCRYFKGATGMTPIEYLTHIRIEDAARMIRETDFKIIDICFMSGFENTSYFIRKFKEYKKTTPKKYSQLCRKKE
jgi:AraC-like DNA-binding protein